MTAVRTHRPRALPRPLLRIAWLLHRSIYRFSGGRAGLSQPELGARFGMMRLATVGRRSGKARHAIVGYFEDGANLVSVAMNGWGEGEPAWWLNLQAHPQATVGLASGSRAVRARAADRVERERLWARLREYPGWGHDVDELAARRSTETSVIILEPRAEARDTALAGNGVRSAREQARDRADIAASPAAIDDRGPRFRLGYL